MEDSVLRGRHTVLGRYKLDTSMTVQRHEAEHLTGLHEAVQRYVIDIGFVCRVCEDRQGPAEQCF